MLLEPTGCTKREESLHSKQLYACEWLYWLVLGSPCGWMQCTWKFSSAAMSRLICKDPSQVIKLIKTRIMNSHSSSHFLNFLNSILFFPSYWQVVNGEWQMQDFWWACHIIQTSNIALLLKNHQNNVQALKAITLPRLLLYFLVPITKRVLHL